MTLAARRSQARSGSSQSNETQRDGTVFEGDGSAHGSSRIAAERRRVRNRRVTALTLLSRRDPEVIEPYLREAEGASRC